MSVSIRASPPSRQRPLLAAERKAVGASSVEMLGFDSRNSLQVNVVSPRRSKRAGRKPLWLAVVSVLVRNFVLLVLLLGFVRLVYKLALKSGGVDVGVGVGELKWRLAEVEKEVKRTTTMLEAKAESVGIKLGNEIRGLGEELRGRIEEKSVGFEAELHRLEAKVENLDLGRLSVNEFLTKEEFEKIKNLNNVGRLDELRGYVKVLVNQEIEKHSADGLGRVDYALASAGGKVVKHSEDFVGQRESLLKKVVGRGVKYQDADVMLRPSFGEPGQCFPLNGSSGFVLVRLRTAIMPEAVTLEHVAESVAYDRSSAPKDCRVSGWLEGPEQFNTEMFLLSEFTYDLRKSSAQTYPVAAAGTVNMVRFDFSSNHGSPSHTCIYRIRVHGRES